MLREVAAGADVPVLLIGSADHRDSVESAREAGAADHLLAPLDHREFRIRARHLLLRREAERRMIEAAEELAARPEHGGDGGRSTIEFLYNMSHEPRTP